MFKLPSDLKKLSADELAAAKAEALEAAAELAKVSDEDFTDEQVAEASQLMSDIEALEAEDGERTSAAADKAERLAALRGKVSAADAAKETEPKAEVTPPAAEEEPVVEAEVVVEEEEKEAVTASAGSAVSQIANGGTEEVEIPVVATPRASITAAANVPDVEAGKVLDTLKDVALAMEARAAQFAGSTQEGRFDRYGVAKIRKPENQFTITEGMSAEDQMAIIMAARDESRLDGGSLVAAGGWCAPSETIYDQFLEVETVDGILSIPEITIRRGGINFTKGPDYATLAATWGFLQTEAQAIAGDAKTCYTITCPPFTDVRLDAIGFCIRAGILTNVGYPEILRRVIRIGLVAHQHKVNASVLTRIGALLGTAINYTEQNSGTSDLLSALELNAEVLRYRYSLAIGASIEVVLPAWARLVVRQDLATRQGVDLLAVSDSDIATYFSVRGLAVQWVYDFQPLDTVAATAGKALPTTVQAYLYPAGAFIKGTTPVIDLDTVYDSTSLQVNMFTAAFFEEGLLVANTGAGGIKLDVALNVKGATGFPAVGAGAGVTIP